MSETKTDVQEYALVDAFTGKTVRTFTSPKATGQSGSMSSTYRLISVIFKNRAHIT